MRPCPNTATLELVRDAAIDMAVDHADGVSPGWSNTAFDHLVLFSRQAKAPFMAEEVRAWAERRGLSCPPDPRAWGGVLQRAARAGIIQSAGFTTSRNRQAHMRPTALWRAE